MVTFMIVLLFGFWSLGYILRTKDRQWRTWKHLPPIGKPVIIYIPPREIAGSLEQEIFYVTKFPDESCRRAFIERRKTEHQQWRLLELPA